MSTDSTAEPGLSFLRDPSMKRARDLRLGSAVCCFIAGVFCLALSLLSPSLAVAGAVAVVLGIAILLTRRRWAIQTARAAHCARDAVPVIAMVVSETTGRFGLRRVTLRGEGAAADATGSVGDEEFTWLLPASWGDLVRLDRTGRRVAALASAGQPENCVPLLRNARPFVIPDYVADALIALLLKDVPVDDRGAGVADLSGVSPGTIPPPPALPIEFAPASWLRPVWWLGLAVVVGWVGVCTWNWAAGDAIGDVAPLLIIPAGLALYAALDRSKAVSAVLRADGIDVRGPLAIGSGVSTRRWDEVASVTIGWTSRAERVQQEEHSLGELALAVGVSAVTMIHFAISRAQIVEAGDLGQRLLRGDIVSELDTVHVSLNSRRGLRIVTFVTRQRFQPIRALLRECAARKIPVLSVQSLA